MKKCIAHVVTSTGGRLGGLSLRDENSSASGFKVALAAAGFKVGDVVAIVEASESAALTLGSLDGIRAAALAFPVEDRNALRMALTASLPIPRCLDTSPAITAKVAQTMTAAQREELIGLLVKGRAS